MKTSSPLRTPNPRLTRVAAQFRPTGATTASSHPAAPIPPSLWSASRRAHDGLAAVAGRRQGIGVGLAGHARRALCRPPPHARRLRSPPRLTVLPAALRLCRTARDALPGQSHRSARRSISNGPMALACVSTAASPSPAPGVGADLFGDALMLQLTPQSRIFLATEPVDFRKGIDGLAAVCRQVLGDHPLEGAVYVFRNRAGTALKLLFYDGQGFWLCTKRLSQGRFTWWPQTADAACPLSARELLILLWNGDPEEARMAHDWQRWPKAGPGWRDSSRATTPPGRAKTAGRCSCNATRYSRALTPRGGRWQ